MANATRRFHFRVRVKDKQGTIGEFLADALTALDETARRLIIEKEYAGGNQVLRICDAGDRKRQPGDWAKRTYQE